MMKVNLAWCAVGTRTGDPGTRTGETGHLVAERSRVRQAGRDHVPGRHARAADADRVRAVEAELVQGLQHSDELRAEAVLERHPLRLHPARAQQHLSVL